MDYSKIDYSQIRWENAVRYDLEESTKMYYLYFVNIFLICVLKI